ncbi:unnamed protein product, partial [Hapterophycus canaliculatus]
PLLYLVSAAPLISSCARKVRHGYFDFPSPEWDNISAEAKDFITQLLQKDPSARMTATQSINHTWFE